jgi:ubiquitin thioesterase protein OTUB1
VIALTTALKACVRVEYLDRSPGDLNHHDFPTGDLPSVYLLYRPGHYDLLYPVAQPP